MKKIICPVAESSRVSQWFGEWPKFYKPLGFRGHPGLDYAVVVRTPVMCCDDGEVISFEVSNQGWGIHVRVQHEGYQSLYAHLSDLRVVEKCFVKKGQVLGRSGNTGNSTGPHLHFGIREPNKMNNGYRGYVDPCIYLNKEVPIIKSQKTIEEVISQPTGNKQKEDNISNKEKETVDNNSLFAKTGGVQEPSFPLPLSRYKKVLDKIIKLLLQVLHILINKKNK